MKALDLLHVDKYTLMAAHERVLLKGAQDLLYGKRGFDLCLFPHVRFIADLRFPLYAFKIENVSERDIAFFMVYVHIDHAPVFFQKILDRLLHRIDQQQRHMFL